MAADSVGAVGAPTAAKYSVAVAQKQQGQNAVQGQQAVQLIQSATPQLASSGSVGTKLNFVA
jgi:hypothetical protein